MARRTRKTYRRKSPSRGRRVARGRASSRMRGRRSGRSSKRSNQVVRIVLDSPAVRDLTHPSLNTKKKVF